MKLSLEFVDEFEFIKTCLAPLAGPEGLKLQDDAAVMTPLP
ncbi:MAG: thiamine-phosphate kinase, partial [Hyphomonadaceae bacterium]|nr:thiamine-phosphate kinase [Hyphomonadaceae bacterium]